MKLTSVYSGTLLRYLDSNRGEKLKELQEKLALSKSQLKICEERKQEISAELCKSKELMSNQGQLKRNIDDNLNYRKTKAEVDELAREIERLEEKVLDIGGMSATEAVYKRLLQEKERLLSEVMFTDHSLLLVIFHLWSTWLFWFRLFSWCLSMIISFSHQNGVGYGAWGSMKDLSKKLWRVQTWDDPSFGATFEDIMEGERLL